MVAIKNYQKLEVVKRAFHSKKINNPRQIHYKEIREGEINYKTSWGFRSILIYLLDKLNVF